MTHDKLKPLKWHTYSQVKKDAIIEEFWRDYFEQYPDEGSSQELNIMRSRKRDIYYRRKYPIYTPKFK